MLNYKSNKGGGPTVDFEKAILDGYALDGGLYVPEYLPKVTHSDLIKWKSLSYKALAFEVLSLFIDRSIVSASGLRLLLDECYDTFETKEVIPFHQLETRDETYIMELFYGPTLSFKDVGMSFIVNLVNFFLKRKKEHLSVIVATTGDTGPAATHFVAGKSNLDAWILYPKGLITEAQERQMTTQPHANVHPVGVFNCPEGGDDLDVVISQLYADDAFKNKLKLSSVNSLNWGRIMMQTVHYFYGYLRIAKEVGAPVNMAVPSGGFGNLCAGGLARKMGLPIHYLVVANNQNACLNRIFTQGVFSKQPIHETVSSAIDILVPINFWRFLYFNVEGDTTKIKEWMETFERTGQVIFDAETMAEYQKGFLSKSISHEQTLKTIKNVFKEEHYLLDPHGAVAVAAADQLKAQLGGHPLICLATAHPAKFHETLEHLLGADQMPQAAMHPSIEEAKVKCQKNYTCHYSHLHSALKETMNTHWDLHHPA